MQSLILAHQGGWDEALMVLVPIGLFIAVLRIADRRAARVRDERAGTDPSSTDDGAQADTSDPRSAG